MKVTHFQKTSGITKWFCALVSLGLSDFLSDLIYRSVFKEFESGQKERLINFHADSY